MKRVSIIISSMLVVLVACQTETLVQDQVALSVKGLKAKVEVVRDSAGVNHIYAENQHDLFFAQGYCAAKDRLFQFEIWRRQATGTVAELLGPRELNRDIGTRLFKFRGDMQEEMDYYHDDGSEIITAYTAGVNAYIQEVWDHPELLPITFKMLGTRPEKWTPDVVISRHQGLLGNIQNELNIGRAVAAIGVEQTKKYYWFHPKDPNLDLDAKIDGDLLTPDYRKPVQFLPQDIVPEYRLDSVAGVSHHAASEDQLWIGSNNWVTRPELSQQGHPYMANDPHRRLAIPSLRYWVHLKAPGWDVIGGGEPEIPGVSIGHNQYGAWGLTVYRTDGEDLYVYDLNPQDLNQYSYQDQWEDMTIIKESIPVKDQSEVTVDLRYTRHGPVTFIDSTNLKAYAVRCAWMEPGGAPYLASLRMDQARSWEEFREACNYSHIPGENMIWVDSVGNIGWQAVGIAPLRRNWSGLVPVPGDGSYEWDGFLPIKQKPHLYNPSQGYIATANEDVTPEDYTEWDAVGFQWSDPYRGQRIAEVMRGGTPLKMQDMISLQTDYKSLPATYLVLLLAELELSEEYKDAKTLFDNWDYRLAPNSPAAALYVTWEEIIRKQYFKYFPDEQAEAVISGLQLHRIFKLLSEQPLMQHKHFISDTFKQAVKQITELQGADPSTWRYGSPDFKHVQLIHPLGNVVKSEYQQMLNTEVLPRGGNQYTPGATGSNYNQSHGATFKIITDAKDWDMSVGMNAPGQSGDPASPYYKNLYQTWAEDGYFKVPYSKEAVVSNTAERVMLLPVD